MPKLDSKTAKRVNSAEGGGGGFTLLDEDEYTLKLTGVKVGAKPNKNGDLGWVWSFEVSSGEQTGDKFKGKPIRTNTWLSEDSDWYLKQMFDAFGAKPNVDTDTLIGKEIRGIVTQREIMAGARKGQLSNDLGSMMPVSDGDADADGWDDGGDDSDPEF
jgi:hypothetical protein